MKKTLALMLALLAGLGAGCAKGGSKLKIGLSMDTLQTERWQHDRDYFVAKCEELGAEVLVQVANSSDALQVSQAENLLTQGVNVLVVIPHDGRACAAIVDSAHKAGVPVVAYDRLIMNSDLDLYVSISPSMVGEMQGAYVAKHRPKGNIVLMGGSPTDNNAVLVREGQMKVLKPLIAKGDLKVVADQWAKDWLPAEGLKIVENALTKMHNKIDIVLASNDGTAGGAIQALAEQKLAGKVLVTGQDADLAACQRIVEGTQAMTVYKSLKVEAQAAAEVAVKLAKKEPLGVQTTPVDNGKIKVPSVLLPPVNVDKDNLNATVIADGFQKLEEVYKNVPKEQWPK